ncbi:ABC transporter permease [Marinobacter vulgaris]|uniref:ABC transporter permease n=2 Tax=Marinobacter vulgaris TaxID=1928331 RepID=A0A2V3ZNY4_9GAMM|nr:ABC transporter permease [Marinobacter vulgaris]PXX92782.1 ABC transporter permease [Marinobacter vulgaris]TSJ71844.1 ABC transporter permease [Marinobacter vulgaris]
MLVRAFISHYRRHPLQLAALALMIVLATMLWTGVTVLTDQARTSLFQSEQAVATRVHVVRTDAQPVGVDDFAQLRMAGVCVAPWLEIQRPPPEGRVIGIDPLAMGCFGEAAPGGNAGELDGAPFLDISEAAKLADDGYDSRLYLLTANGSVVLPEGYALRDFSLGPSTGELADSFLLNLDALSLLVLLITGLLVRSVHRLGIAQRQQSFDLLYRFGVPRERVRQFLALELVVLTGICVLPGLWLGAQLAGMLGGGFGQALDSLFDVTVYAGSAESLPWQAAGVMVVLVLAVCLVDWLLPRRWQTAAVSARGRLLAVAVLLFGLVGVALAPGLGWVFVGTALVFAGTGWLTPGLLALLARWLSDRTDGKASDPLTRWRRRELAVMFSHLALPVVALQFAMATVLAVQALVTTFEQTFDEWLAQRLEAEFYVEVPRGADAGLAAEHLQSLAGIGAWHRVIRGEARMTVDKGESVPVDLFALTPVSDLVAGWTLLASIDQPWRGLEQGGVMLNEQLARRRQLDVGDNLTVTIADSVISADIVAIYADYGRPAGEILVAGGALPESFRARFESFSVNPGDLDMADIREQLADVWSVPEVTVRDNASIRALASQVFGQTFLLTRAISLLTLVLAAIALLIMGWVFFTTRVWYFRLLGIWGLPARAIQRQLRRLSVTLTLAVTMAALPLGIWLTWVLVSRINPLAFGWSLPMDLYPLFWIELGLVAAVTGLVVAHLMRRQLVQRAGEAQGET